MSTKLTGGVIFSDEILVRACMAMNMLLFAAEELTFEGLIEVCVYVV